jgi:hypothetical protein
MMRRLLRLGALTAASAAGLLAAPPPASLACARAAMSGASPSTGRPAGVTTLL